MPYIRPRKDARVVEWNSLENCLSRKANEGSNPSLSAPTQLHFITAL